MAVPINYLAVVAAAVASFVLGFLWYGPIFGKQWMVLSGINPDKPQKGMMKMMVMSFIGSFLMSYAFAHSLVFANTYLNASGIFAALMGAFWTWLGFIAPVTLSSVLWEGKPWKLWILNNAFYLVSLSVMGTILVFWA